VEVVVSLSQGRTAAAQCGLFTYKSVPIIFEPPCIYIYIYIYIYIHTHKPTHTHMERLQEPKKWLKALPQIKSSTALPG